MDVLTGLFVGDPHGPAFLLRTQFVAPFALTIADEAPLTVLLASRGDLTVERAGESLVVPESHLVLVRGDRTWSLSDERDTAVRAVIHPGQRCETPTGEPLADRWSLGIRTWGNADDASATHVVLVGTYERVPETGRQALEALPPVLLVPEGAIDPGLLAMFADEVVRDDVAQPVVLSRALDLVVVLAVRHWMRHHESLPPGVLRGLADPVVGPAIRLMQAEPAERWTIQWLARRVGVSRSVLAKRFADVVGTTPIAFLTEWRLSVAADRLTTSTDSIGAVASDVGYGSAFALSTAFKRRFGVSPHHYRTSSVA
jgi:AraC-like DNA-binding protein